MLLACYDVMLLVKINYSRGEVNYTGSLGSACRLCVDKLRLNIGSIHTTEHGRMCTQAKAATYTAYMGEAACVLAVYCTNT